MPPDVSKRLLSLDLFRGLTIAAMIIVNNLGSGQEGARFRALVHSEWHGCTPADLIFPFFVFIVGVAAVFSLGQRAQTGGREPAAGLPAYFQPHPENFPAGPAGDVCLRLALSSPLPPGGDRAEYLVDLHLPAHRH